MLLCLSHPYHNRHRGNEPSEKVQRQVTRPLSLAAAPLRQPPAVGLGHVRELVGLAVVLTLAAPGPGAAASVPASRAGFDVPGLDVW